MKLEVKTFENSFDLWPAGGNHIVVFEKPTNLKSKSTNAFYAKIRNTLFEGFSYYDISDKTIKSFIQTYKIREITESIPSQVFNTNNLYVGVVKNTSVELFTQNKKLTISKFKKIIQDYIKEQIRDLKEFQSLIED